jgi:hypothetical protein
LAKHEKSGGLAPANLRTFETDVEAEDFFDAALDLAGLEVEVVGDFDVVEVDGGVEAAFGEDVNEDGEGNGVVKELVFRIDVGATGDGVADDDGHHLSLDEIDNGLHDFRMFDLVAIQAANQILTGVADDFAGNRESAEEVVGAGVEFEGALVFELANDVFLDQFEGRLGVDEVVVEDFFEGDEGVVGFLFEDFVAIAGEAGVEVGGAFFPEFAEAGAADFLIVFKDFLAAFELAGDAFAFIDEQHHDVEDGLFEVGGVGGVGEIAAEAHHFVEEHFEALDLNFGAREAVEDGAVLLFWFEEFADEDADDFAVADHATLGLEFLGFGGVEEGADDDGVSGDAPEFANEVSVGAFAGAGGAAEEDEFFGEAEVFATVFGFEFFPDVIEDELGIFDFQVGRGGGFGRGVWGDGLHGEGKGIGKLMGMSNAQSGDWRLEIGDWRRV